MGIRISDQEIIERLISREHEMITLCYNLFYDRVTKLLIGKHSFNEDMAKDVFQESILAVWRNTAKPGFKLTSTLFTYLSKIATNQSTRHLENADADKLIPLQPSHEKVLQEPLIEDSTLRDKRLTRCLDCLTPFCKQVIKLYYFERMSADAIVQHLSLANTDSAKSLKYKCLQKLKVEVSKRYQQQDFELEYTYI